MIVDGDRVIHDSWAIAEYLEATYTTRPCLVERMAHYRFITDWLETVLYPEIFRVVAITR